MPGLYPGKIPRLTYTDKLRTYLEAIELTFGAETKHKQGNPFDVKNNTNHIERMQGTIKSMTKVMRGLHSIESAKRYLDDWLAHYNYFWPYMSLKDSTPAKVAGIEFPFRNWKELVEQPYSKTARIPIKEYVPDIILPITTPTIRRKKSIKITPKTPRISKPTPSLSAVRVRRLK